MANKNEEVLAHLEQWFETHEACRITMTNDITEAPSTLGWRNYEPSGVVEFQVTLVRRTD